MSALFTLLFLGALGTGIYYLAKHVGFIEYYKNHVLRSHGGKSVTGCKYSPSDVEFKFKKIDIMLDSIDTVIESIKKQQAEQTETISALENNNSKDHINTAHLLEGIRYQMFDIDNKFNGIELDIENDIANRFKGIELDIEQLQKEQKENRHDSNHDRETNPIGTITTR